MVKRITTADFIAKAKSIHGDKYDYSFACYLSAKSNVQIICPIHGLFEQQAYIHANGSGCPDCGGTKKKNTAQFIKEAKQVHGEKYDYSQSVYVNASKKIKITCPTHGTFNQQPTVHLLGSGCPDCAGCKKKNTEIFIQEARKIHGDEYDYSKTKYINDGSKDGTTLTIICPVHGEFEQRGSVHLKGSGCSKCGHGEKAKKRRKTQEDFIKEAKNKHGKKYDYSKAEYKGDKEKVEIICPEHGSFWQSAGGHLSGKGCTPCYRKRQHLISKDELSDFIDKARSVHGDKYNYSKAEYKLSGVKVEIICPEHGSFWQTPNAHISRKSQCPKCAHESGKLKLRLSLSDFIEKAKSVHGDKYDYSKAEYINSHTKTLIICQIHGEFWQIPNSHLSGLGCDKCGGTSRLSREEAIQRAKERHGSKYDYSKVQFNTITDKVEIICPDHGSFYQQMQSHFMKCGCPKCAEYGFNPQKPSIIYFLKLQTAIAVFWKIGITNRTVEERFRKDYDLIQSGWIWHGDGEVIWNTEQQLLRQYQDYKLNYLFPLLQNGGDTECFSLDLPVKKIIKTITDQLKTPPEEIRAGQKQTRV